MRNEKTFCWAPWTDLSLEIDGSIRPCCVYRDSVGDYKSPSDLPISFQSERLRQVRQTFLAGQTPEACFICYDNESVGAPSKRLKIERRLKKDGFDLTQTPDLESELLQSLELNFSNSCNLVCVTCSSVSSSSWQPLEADFEQKTGQTRPQGIKTFEIPIGDVPDLIEASRKLRSVQIIGGEPLLNRSSREYLKQLSVVNPDCDISITTNGTFFDSEIFKVLSAFRRGAIDFSIDGTGKIYEYIRGTSFSRLEERVHLACELPPQIMVGVHLTLSLYNAFNLPEMIRWVEGLQVLYPDRKVRLILNQMVRWPSQMRVSLIPLPARQGLATELRSFLNSPALSSDELASLIDYLLTGDDSTDEALRQQAVASTTYFNEKRRLSIYDLESRLSFKELSFISDRQSLDR